MGSLRGGDLGVWAFFLGFLVGIVLDLIFFGDQPMDRRSRFPRIKRNRGKSHITWGQNLGAATLQLTEGVKGEAVGKNSSAALLFATELPAGSINSGAIYEATKWTKPGQRAGELCPRFVAWLDRHDTSFYHQEVKSVKGGKPIR